MPTLCTWGLSCKTCRRDGTRDDGKRITSGLKRHRCTARWLQNGSHGKAKEQHSLFVIKSTVGGKRIGKLQVDGWCSTTNTAYQFHGYFYHGHQCLGLETNAVNGKPMTQLLAETRKNTAYLRHFVKVGMWECEWNETGRDTVVKKCLDAAFPRQHHVRWTMTTARNRT